MIRTLGLQENSCGVASLDDDLELESTLFSRFFFFFRLGLLETLADSFAYQGLLQHVLTVLLEFARILTLLSASELLTQSMSVGSRAILSTSEKTRLALARTLVAASYAVPLVWEGVFELLPSRTLRF